MSQNSDSKIFELNAKNKSREIGWLLAERLYQVEYYEWNYHGHRSKCD